MTEPTKPATSQYRSLHELEDRQATVRAELALLDEKTELTEEDVNYQGTLIDEHDALDAKVQPLRERMAGLARVAAAAAVPENREEPAAATGGIAERFGGKAPEGHVRSNRDPLEDLDRVRQNLVSRDDLRARSLDLIEQTAKRNSWEFSGGQAEAATVRAQGNPSIGKHILLTGTNEYREAFRAYLDDPLNNEHRLRAVNLTNASGGYLLPFILDPSIVLTNSASANPFRRVCRVVQTTSNAWQGVSSAGVNAALVAEAATAADAAPTDLAQIQLSPKKAAAWILGTYEALDDTNFGEQLPGMIADARDRLESSYFATGSGTNAPLGIVTAMGTSGRVVPSATGTAFGTTANLPDIGKLMATLPPRFRRSNSCAFMANIVHLNAIRQMDQYGGGGFWANFTSQTPSALYGYPVYEASDLPSVTTGSSAASGTASDTLFLGDWQQMILCDRVGMSMLYDPLIKGTGANAQLPAGEAGWYAFWRFTSGISTTAGFRNLTIS